jgi:hypothetical protein
MTYQDEIQQYEERIARNQRITNRLLILCFILIILLIGFVISFVGWLVSIKPVDPPRKAGYTKIEYGLGVNTKGDTVKIFEYSNQ